MEKTKRKFSLDFKIKAVELSKQRGSLAAVAQELDISADNLKRWKKEYNLGQLTDKIRIKSPEEIELIQLRKELNDVRMERDILKKAVSIFSKSDR